MAKRWLPIRLVILLRVGKSSPEIGHNPLKQMRDFVRILRVFPDARPVSGQTLAFQRKGVEALRALFILFHKSIFVEDKS